MTSCAAGGECLQLADQPYMSRRISDFSGAFAHAANIGSPVRDSAAIRPALKQLRFTATHIVLLASSGLLLPNTVSCCGPIRFAVVLPDLVR